jgi:D-sedoheptulose 7-phosphate isomerase
MNRVDQHIAEYFGQSAAAYQAVADNSTLVAEIARIAKHIALAINSGHKILLAGNGGSAADAQHLAAEFLSRFVKDRRPLPAIALTTDTSVLTAIGNDFGFKEIFARQVQGLASEGDVFIGLSTSGNSPNILAALTAARAVGITTIGFTGSNGGQMQSICDYLLLAPSAQTAIIQQIHIAAGHAICGIIEDTLAA